MHSHTILTHKTVTHLIRFPLPIRNQQQKPAVMDVTMWAGLSRTCGQQKFWGTRALVVARLYRVGLKKKCKETPRSSGFFWGEDVSGGGRGSTLVGFIGRIENRGSRKESYWRVVQNSTSPFNFFSLFILFFSFKDCCPRIGQRQTSPPTPSGHELKTWGEPNLGWKCQGHVQPQENIAHVSLRLMSKPDIAIKRLLLL